MLMAIYIVRGSKVVHETLEEAQLECHNLAYDKHLQSVLPQAYEVNDQDFDSPNYGTSYIVYPKPDFKNFMLRLDEAVSNYKHDMETGIDTYYIKEELLPE